MNEDIVTLIDDDNNEVPFEVIEKVIYNEKTYFVMQPVDDPEFEEGEVVIMALEEEDVLIPVDSDLEEKVFNEFMLILESDEIDD